MDIEGTVIIPSAYQVNHTVQVCDDKNNSNSCDSGETTVAVDPPTGSFSIKAAYPLVAEFYTVSTSSGTSISAQNGALPVLVYTTPAGESTISAFTTMVKNTVDTQPGLYNAISGAEKVKADTTITFDPFNAASYATNAVLHDKVSAVTAGILAYICNTLNITPDTFSPGVILALYNVVYAIVDDIVTDPSVDVNTLVNTNKGSIDNTAIANADDAVGEVWNFGNDISGLYNFRFENNKVVVEGADEQAKPLPTDMLPPTAFRNLSDYNLVINRATVASPDNITTSERFNSKTFTLGTEAKVYTLVFTQDFSKNVQSMYDLERIHSVDHDQFKGDDMDTLYSSGFDGTFAVTTIINGDHNITFSPNVDKTSGTFDWNYSGTANPFSSNFPFMKSGDFLKVDGYEAGAFKLTATDGSVAIIFKYFDHWVLATYPIREGSLTLFNQAAAQNIIDQWKTDFTPLW